MLQAMKSHPESTMSSRIRELESRLLERKRAVEYLESLLSLAELYGASGRSREGLRCAREALNIARARGDSRSSARALAVAMRCHHQRGDFPAAVAAGLNAVEAFEESDLAGRSSALQGVARALLAVEALDLAEEAAERAAADALKGGNPTVEAGARTVLGSILMIGNRFGEARRLFREAGAIQRRLGDTLQLKKSAANIADGYLSSANQARLRGDDSSARLLWRQAKRVFRVAVATGASAAEDALALAGIAECEWRLDNHAEALAAARRAVELAEHTRSPLVLAQCRLWESHALRAVGDLDAARRACEAARNAAEQVEHGRILAECLKAESRLNDLAGRFESAHDLEQRAEHVSIEREEFFARIRHEVVLLWTLHLQPPEPMPRRVAC
jgi:tetratricopeptide (TPR) repeat protein